MAEPIELPDAYAHLEPEFLEGLVQHRIDRELESSLLRDQLDYREKRSRMPAAVRNHWDQVERDA